MKVSRDQVAEHHSKVVDAASRLFRERGFESVTLDDVMNEAGLTRGAFYGHFKSKDDLMAQACAHAVRPDAENTAATLHDYSAEYLSAFHRDNRTGGCSFAALGAEAARQSLSIRHGMTEGLKRKIAHMSAFAAGDTDETRRAAAISSLSTMLGGLILSRLVDDPALSEEILRTNRDALAASHPAHGIS
ncbi:MAG TPA: TetR family transcriptional regulator [Afipia sp.]